MVASVLKILVFKATVFTVLSQHLQPTAKYIHVNTMGQTSYPTFFHRPPLTGPPSQPNPPKISDLSSPAVLTLPDSSLANFNASSKTKSCAPSTSIGGFDSTVLNNLAIALQLLTLSHILNLPPPNESEENDSDEKSSNTVTPSKVSYIAPNLEYANPQQSQPYYPSESYKKPSNLFTNANFLGTSSFTNPVQNLADLSRFSSLDTFQSKPPRPSLGLMSPYEALASDSPFSDPILSSPYAVGPKKDLQSPYASILAADNAKDLFSFTDLF